MTRVTMDKLEEVQPEIIAPLHCTGEDATEKIHDRFGNVARFLSAGEKIDIC